MIGRLSLAARLLAIAVALLVVGLVVISSVVLRQLETQLMARVDAQLEPMGKAASAIPPDLVAKLSRSPLPAGQFDLMGKGFVAYLAADGSVLRELGDLAGPALPRLDSAAVAARAGQPFTVNGTDGEEWRAVALPRAGTNGPRPASGGTSLGPAGHTAVVAAVSLAELHTTVDRLRVACLLTGAVLLGVLALVGGVAIRAGLAPLRRVEETAAAIADGDLTRRVPEPAGLSTEVGRLARSLNKMLAQIEQGVAAKVESEARMRGFVADVSHELRTPLFGIKGFSELYRMGGTEAGPALARIESESGRLARLVEDLLLLASLDERDGPGLDLTPMDLRTLAADARHDFTALAPSRPIAFTGPSGGPAASAPVLGDEARLRQVVSNLVGNAITHTPAGTPVRIGVGTDGGESVLVIEDEGPGLSPEEEARVFDRFYRADASRARATGGAGLGLAIVRSIVTAHGGRVEVRSAPGKGATFQVRLPTADPH
ncbi:sensor histidine kinase [Nonomuraea angiospora]|uniref:sensor histidine kinase n=1 Tax=Nonomuraea angiospora TaxID=46172 RepID=UPI0029AF6C61|nr:HAMP domain-containing sensor histidine kinase [Nonomuraea angiospora]MDX3105079.1 HAMP domain-containing sensor histidine kinase [Nonomuraea angiospora]